jgi:hypothetical protein
MIQKGTTAMDDNLLDAAHRALFAAVGRRNQEFPELRQLGEFLNRYVSAAVVIDGQEIEYPNPSDRDSFRYAIGKGQLRNNGIKPYLFYDLYEEAVMRGGATNAVLDPELLHDVVPTSWVPILAALIAEGPDIAARRAQAAIFDYSRERVLKNRRRAAGQRSRSMVQIVVSEAKCVLQIIHDLRALPACRHWTHVPELRRPNMPEGGYQTIAPRPETVRHALQDITASLHERLGVNSIDDELRVISALSDNQIARRGLWRPARDRAMLVLMVLTGGRRTALARLRRMDYVCDHEGPPPDCRRGAALDLRPRKGKDREEVRRKPIPHGAALVLDVYLTLMDRTIKAHGHPQPPPKTPLLVAEPSHFMKQVREDWLYRRVAGTPKTRALVPRDTRHIDVPLTDQEHAHCGYTPHEYRHFADQLAERSGEIWNKRYPATGAEANPPIPYYAAALLDNGGIDNDLRALYGDRCAPAMLEVVAGRAAEIGWELLTTDLGMRKRPDLAAYEREMTRLRTIEDDERRLEKNAQKLQARYTRCGQRTPRTPKDDRIDEILRRQEEQLAAIDELKEMVLESSRITHELVTVSRRKADTIIKADMFRFDQTTWLPIPDSEPPGAEQVDWDAIDKGKLGKALLPTDTPIAVRDWVTFHEFCLIAGLEARSTLTRWAKGEHIPTRRDKRPWEPQQVPIDTSLGVNYRRIWVPGMHEAFWRTALMRDALTEILTHWPLEQGWTTKDGQPTARCQEPLRISPARLHLVEDEAA